MNAVVAVVLMGLGDAGALFEAVFGGGGVGDERGAADKGSQGGGDLQDADGGLVHGESSDCVVVVPPHCVT